VDIKDLIKWGAIIILGWLALRWLMNLATTLAGGIGSGISDGGWNAPYVAPLSAPYYVRPWSPPQRGRYRRGQY
jgi:hypothetical protein